MTPPFATLPAQKGVIRECSSYVNAIKSRFTMHTANDTGECLAKGAL